jgi:hypothetical protein
MRPGGRVAGHRGRPTHLATPAEPPDTAGYVPDAETLPDEQATTADHELPKAERHPALRGIFSSTLCGEIPEARRAVCVRSCQVNVLLNRDGRSYAHDAGQK